MPVSRSGSTVAADASCTYAVELSGRANSSPARVSPVGSGAYSDWSYCALLAASGSGVSTVAVVVAISAVSGLHLKVSTIIVVILGTMNSVLLIPASVRMGTV